MSPNTLKCAAVCAENKPVTPLGRLRQEPKVKKIFFSAEDCANIQDLDLSYTQTKILIHDLRCLGGSWNILEQKAYAKIQE